VRFGSVPIDEASGCVLAHSHRLPGGALRKGLVLTPGHVERLREAGVTSVIVARLEDGDVGEDVAAATLGSRLPGAFVRTAAARTGRVNLFAERDGVLVIDAPRVDGINAIDEALTVATLRAHSVVRAGELIATVKVIPYAVRQPSLDAACAVADRAVLRVAPFRVCRAGLILSRTPGLPERLLESAEAAQRQRLASLGVELARVVRTPHTVDGVADGLGALLDEGLDPVLFLGASAVIDRRDVLPTALERVGGTVDHLGMPVDPGNLLLLGHRGEATVVGVPGCARSLKTSGFDWVLERVVAGLQPSTATLRGMGVGGLLKEIPIRTQPRQGSRRAKKIAALVLAAGRSRRMGADNKLLVDLEGQPLLARTLSTLAASAATPLVVVTGHDADAVGEVARAAGARVVHNPDHQAGMSTSIRAGLAALDEVDGVLIALGDMPFVRPQDIEALLEAFDPDGGAPIVVPVHDRKRGHPVLWAWRYVPELLAITGDVGARSVLSAHADDVHLVPVPDPGIHLDVDTPEALALVRRGERPVVD
jgi:molybdenum cofactor cytidylyltransferase